MKYQPRNKTVATSITEEQMEWLEKERQWIKEESGVEVSLAQILYRALLKAGMPERK